MAKVIDITEQLNFEDNPKIKIGKMEYEVNTDAASMLKVMQLLGNVDDISPKNMVEIYEIMFSEKERKKIDNLHLKFDDFIILVQTAITLVTGEELGE